MDERVIKFRVGIVVVAAVIITIILVMLFGAGPAVLQRQYELHVKFPEAPGITVDTPVRKSGVLIGRVSDVELLDEGGVLVSANIYDRYKLRQNETCRIGTGSLIGDAVLEFVPIGKPELLARFDADGSGELDREETAKTAEEMVDGDFMSQGLVASNPLQVLVNLEGTIENAFDSLQGAGNEVTGLVRSVNQTMGDDEGQLRRIMQKTEVALDRFDSTMRAFESVLGDEELTAELKQSLAGLPEVINSTRDTMKKAGETMDTFQRATLKAEARLDDIAGFTEPLRDNGPQLAENVLEISSNLKFMTAELQVFSEALNSKQGTFSRLVHDDELYRQIEGIVDNVEDVSRLVKPIANDIRIFTDKIAREPSQLGLKGAIDRRSPGLKTGIMVR